MQVQTAPPFVDQAEAQIRRWILEGRLEPGARINEVEIAAELGISRSPVREALQRLANERLVRLVPRRGAHVATFDRTEVQELLEVREALEVMAAQLGARRRTKQDVADLAELLDSAEAIIDRDSTSMYPSDRDFHRRLLQTARNERLAQAAVGIYTQIQLARTLSGAAPHRARQALEEHRVILVAIEAGDELAAASTTRLHLENSMQTMRRVFRLEPA